VPIFDLGNLDIVIASVSKNRESQPFKTILKTKTFLAKNEAFLKGHH
jgi:hypothetical protein